MPIYLDGFGDQARPSILGATLVEGFREGGIGEEFIGLEGQSDADGLRIALFRSPDILRSYCDFWPHHLEILETFGDDLGVLGVDELIDFWWCALED